MYNLIKNKTPPRSTERGRFNILLGLKFETKKESFLSILNIKEKILPMIDEMVEVQLGRLPGQTTFVSKDMGSREYSAMLALLRKTIPCLHGQ